MIALPRLFLSASTDGSRPLVRRSAGLLTTLELWAARRRQRRALLELSEHMLKDIGISAADAYKESQKPFWRY